MRVHLRIMNNAPNNIYSSVCVYYIVHPSIPHLNTEHTHAPSAEHSAISVSVRPVYGEKPNSLCMNGAMCVYVFQKDTESFSYHQICAAFIVFFVHQHRNRAPSSSQIAQHHSNGRQALHASDGRRECRFRNGRKVWDGKAIVRTLKPTENPPAIPPKPRAHTTHPQNTIRLLRGELYGNVFSFGNSLRVSVCVRTRSSKHVYCIIKNNIKGERTHLRAHPNIHTEHMR